MITGNPNYWNLYATKGHNHDDKYFTKHIRTVLDFNDALCEGGYKVANDSTGVLNAPYTGEIYGKLLVYVSTGDRHNDWNNWIWQIFYDTSGGIYFRYKVNNAPWHSWRPLPSKINTYGAWWNDGVVTVKSDGVCEVGKYLDFHTGHGNTADYDGRIEVDDYDFWFSKSINPWGTLQLGSTSNRWTYLNLVNSPNISSDRNMKKDIKYLCHDKSDTELDYGDMYDFVKDELELAEYKFKNGEDKKIGFIAQDLLYNNEYNDSKVGQFIVPPIATPTVEEKAEMMERLREGEDYKDPTLSYDMSNYINVLAGALKVSLNKIETLTNRVETLEQTVNQLLDKVNSDL